MIPRPTGSGVRFDCNRRKSDATFESSALGPYGSVWCHHYFDPELGLHLNRYRDYDPQLGRYIEPDPLGHAGGINLYAYCRDPIGEVDLLGLKPPCKGASTWFREPVHHAAGIATQSRQASTTPWGTPNHSPKHLRVGYETREGGLDAFEIGT